MSGNEAWNINPRAYNLTLNEAVDLAHVEPSSVEAEVYALLVVHARKEDVNRYRDIALHPSGGLTYTIRYDTVRDAILTCAQKPTRVSLIYGTEPTTKKWNTEKKLKSEKRICSEVSANSPGNPRSQPRRRKGRLRWKGFAEKEWL